MTFTSDNACASAGVSAANQLLQTLSSAVSSSTPDQLLNLNQSLIIAEAIQKTANNTPVSIAIVDFSANLKTFYRMDGANLAGIGNVSSNFPQTLQMLPSKKPELPNFSKQQHPI